MGWVEGTFRGWKRDLISHIVKENFVSLSERFTFVRRMKMSSNMADQAESVPNMHIHFTLFSLFKEAREPQPCDLLTATVVMVTVWARAALAHLLLRTGQRENFRHQLPSTQTSRPPFECRDRAIHPLNVCVCGLRSHMQICISIDTLPRVPALTRSL